jgi:hypothetical protein
MSDVRVYFAGIPASNKNSQKTEVLHRFHQGIFTETSEKVFKPEWKESRLAVIQGWAHAYNTASHLKFRKTVIEKQIETGNQILVIDSNIFQFADPALKFNYLRYSLNGIFPTTGNYFTSDVEPMRWRDIKRTLNFELHPWRSEGSHILVCLQRDGGWSMQGQNVMEWLRPTIHKIREHSKLPIVVRPHPGDRAAIHYLVIDKKEFKKVYISSNKKLIDDLQGAWATITYNSSPGAVSALLGVPVFITDPTPENSQAYSVGNADLSMIPDPMMPDRQDWAERLAMSHYNFKDLDDGEAWRIIRKYI